jgi:hypothetical protein
MKEVIELALSKDKVKEALDITVKNPTDSAVV